MYPNEQMLVYKSMVEQLSGKSLASPIFIRAPQLGDFHLEVQILPARDRPARNIPSNFIGVPQKLAPQERQVRIEIKKDLEGRAECGGSVLAKVASQELWDDCCEAAKHSGPMQFEICGVPKDDGTDRIDYEVLTIKNLPAGDASPIFTVA